MDEQYAGRRYNPAGIGACGWPVVTAKPNLIPPYRSASEIAFLRIRDSSSTE